MSYLDRITPAKDSAVEANNPSTTDEPLPAHRLRPVWLIVTIILGSLVVISAAGWLLTHRASSVPKISPTRIHLTTPQPDNTGNATPTSYVSKGQDLNLSITYPSDWTVTPPTGGNTNDQPITLTSPRASLADSNDESVVARAVIAIRPKSADITELDAGTATVADTSVQIAYSHPTKIQHSYPYITFIHLSGGDNPKQLFEEVMITGANKFTKAQVLSSYSLLQLDPIISVTFYQCLTEDCSGDGAKPLSISNDTWQTSDLGQQALAIFQSLQLH